MVYSIKTIYTLTVLQSICDSHIWFIPFEAAKHLSMAQEFAKVYVEHVTSGAQHDVVVMAIADSQHVSGHTASCT